MLSGSKTTVMTGKSWIIDTGASNHMTGEIGDFKDLTEIAPCPVGLPDGSSTVATKEGTVILDRNFCLKNVLFVPGLACKLISVSQLTDYHNCFVQFTNGLCVIQDRTLRTLIGAGERRDGLYFFKAVSRVQALTASGMASLDLWHKRLGHPSLQITKLVPEVSVMKSETRLNKSCDVCQRAKQIRDKFPVSENNAKAIFELVHCDLWGPYRTVSYSGASYFFDNC